MVTTDIWGLGGALQATGREQMGVCGAPRVCSQFSLPGPGIRGKRQRVAGVGLQGWGSGVPQL